MRDSIKITVVISLVTSAIGKVRQSDFTGVSAYGRYKGEVSANNWISILAALATNYTVLAEMEFSLKCATIILPDNRWWYPLTGSVLLTC